MLSFKKRTPVENYDYWLVIRPYLKTKDRNKSISLTAPSQFKIPSQYIIKQYLRRTNYDETTFIFYKGNEDQKAGPIQSIAIRWTLTLSQSTLGVEVRDNKSHRSRHSVDLPGIEINKLKICTPLLSYNNFQRKTFSIMHLLLPVFPPSFLFHFNPVQKCIDAVGILGRLNFFL